jgi:hypothetical protein
MAGPDLDPPCCDYRDHGGNHPACACPDHHISKLHPFGYREHRIITARDITPDECPWLDDVVPAGTPLWTFTGATYGVIGDGESVSTERGRYPFFEIPRGSYEVIG